MDSKLRFPMDQVTSAKALSTTLLGQHLIGVEVQGHSLLQFGIYGHELRDAIVRRIEVAKEQSTASLKPDALSPVSRAMDNISLSSASTAVCEKDKDSVVVSSPGDVTPPSSELEWRPSLTSPRKTIDSDSTLFSRRAVSADPCPIDQDMNDTCKDLATTKLAPLAHSIEFVRSYEVPTEVFTRFPRPINLPRDMLRGMTSRHFVCLTIGSRGDVQCVQCPFPDRTCELLSRVFFPGPT
jgi:hypothetical protein